MLLAFAMPAVMLGFMHAPESLVQGIYAKHAGVPLTQLALAILLTRVLDGVTYPLIGYLSDLTRARRGGRKTWIIGGTGVTVLGLWFLYRPPEEVSAYYFGGWFMVTYVGWKMTEIPYSAWSFELSSDYVQRARIQVWRGMGVLVGTLVFYTVPYAAKAFGLTRSTELDLHTLSLTAVVVLVLVPVLNAWCLLTVPDGGGAVRSDRDTTVKSLRMLLQSISGNGPLIRLLVAYIPVSICSGMAGGVVYLFADAYLHQGEHLPAVFLVAVPLTLVGLPFWGWLCSRYERHRVWAISLLLGAVPSIALGFVTPGSFALAGLMIFYPITMFALVAVSVAVPAMTGDIVDYGRLRFGQDRAGVYAALFAFLNKSLMGVSAALGLAIAGWFGFDATAASHSTFEVLGLKLVAIWIPALSLIGAATVIWNFPLHRGRLRVIQRALAKRPNDVTSTVVRQGPEAVPEHPVSAA
jgi:GPH family glycoside/pentoside/hexuronide:cation symporter